MRYKDSRHLGVISEAPGAPCLASFSLAQAFTPGETRGRLIQEPPSGGFGINRFSTLLAKNISPINGAQEFQQLHQPRRERLG